MIGIVRVIIFYIGACLLFDLGLSLAPVIVVRVEQVFYLNFLE